MGERYRLQFEFNVQQMREINELLRTHFQGTTSPPFEQKPNSPSPPPVSSTTPDASPRTEHASSIRTQSEHAAFLRTQSEHAASPYWSTPNSIHNFDKILKVCYTESLNEVDGGEDSTGWLFSTSKNLLVLWHCLQEAESREPLVHTHSIPIEERIVSMEVAENSNVLIAASVNTTKNQPSLALYALQQHELLSVKARIPTKCEASQVISLQSMGRPLSQLIGCAVQQHIFIYDLAQSFTPQTPKASWAASSTEPICLLRSNPYAAAMYSGACDGAVLLWDLKAPPRQASLKFLQHSRAVTAAEMLNEHSLLTSSADSTILQWDIRNSEQPVRSTVPDGKSVLHLRVSPLNNLLAFATLKGLYLMDGASFAMTPLTAPDSKSIFPDMCWNRKSAALYAATLDGQIAVISLPSKQPVDFE